MNAFEQIRQAREQMEASIREAVAQAVVKFQDATGAYPEDNSIEIRTYEPIGMPTKCIVGRVSASVKI